ncbi:MAG: hypothetical protein ACXVC7_13720, partial [Bacteroidia bacterium]
EKSALTQGMQRLSPKVKDGWIYKPKKERAWLGFGLKNREQQSMEQMEQIEQQNILSNFSEGQENKKDKNILTNWLKVSPKLQKIKPSKTIFAGFTGKSGSGRNRTCI